MSNKKLHVLLAEGASGEMGAALRALYPVEQDGMEMTVVSSVSTLIATLEIVNPEVILFDLSLGHPDPAEAVRRVHRSAPDVPFIVFGAAADKGHAARSLTQGALDYVLKESMEPATLKKVLRAALERNTLGGLADLLRDAVTGLYIRDGFLALGERAMEEAKRKNSTLVLLCVRIENLPRMRAEYGPSAVENSLREVAAVLGTCFRRTDIVARLGDSQFAALAVDAAEPSTPVLCQRLEKRFAVLNQDSGPWGPLETCMNARFWSSMDASSFPAFLDSVEAGLRKTVTVPADGSALSDVGTSDETGRT